MSNRENDGGDGPSVSPLPVKLDSFVLQRKDLSSFMYDDIICLISSFSDSPWNVCMVIQDLWIKSTALCF